MTTSGLSTTIVGPRWTPALILIVSPARAEAMAIAIGESARSRDDTADPAATAECA
jgi:hypothetical protein